MQVTWYIQSPRAERPEVKGIFSIIRHVERMGSHFTNHVASAVMLDGVFSGVAAFEDAQIGFASSALEAPVRAPSIEYCVKDSCMHPRGNELGKSSKVLMDVLASVGRQAMKTVRDPMPSSGFVTNAKLCIWSISLFETHHHTPLELGSDALHTILAPLGEMLVGDVLINFV